MYDKDTDDGQDSEEVAMTVVSRYELCKCPCPPGIKNMSLTEEQLETKVKEIEKELTIDIARISAWKRTKNSAEDHRKSVEIAKGITITIFCLIFGLMALIDGCALVKNLHKKLSRRWRRVKRRKERERRLAEERSASEESSSARIVPWEIFELFYGPENEGILITEQ